LGPADRPQQEGGDSLTGLQDVACAVDRLGRQLAQVRSGDRSGQGVRSCEGMDRVHTGSQDQRRYGDGAPTCAIPDRRVARQRFQPRHYLGGARAGKLPCQRASHLGRFLQQPGIRSRTFETREALPAAVAADQAGDLDHDPQVVRHGRIQPGGARQHQSTDAPGMADRQVQRYSRAHRDAAGHETPHAQLVEQRQQIVSETVEGQFGRAPERPCLAVCPAIQGQQAHAGLGSIVFKRLVDVATQSMLKDEGQARAGVDIIEAEAVVFEDGHGVQSPNSASLSRKKATLPVTSDSARLCRISGPP
jgi:hypothetical protein